MMEKIRFYSSRIIVYALCILTGVFIVYPLIFTFITSIKPTKEYFLDPIGMIIVSPTFDNYKNIINNFDFFQKLTNTSLVVFASTLLVFMFAVPSAYYLNNHENAQFKRTTILFCFLFMFIPEEVFILPEYNMMSDFGLINNYFSVILIYFTSLLPEAIFLLSIYFGLIPEEIKNAAQIDGTDELSYLVKIVIPLSISPIIVVMMTTAIALWNSFLTPMVMLYEEKYKLLLPSLSGLITKHNSDPTYQMAGILLSLIPLVIVYLFFRKKIFESSIGGAIR